MNWRTINKTEHPEVYLSFSRLDSAKHSFWKPARELAFILASHSLYCKLIAHDIHLGVSFKSLSITDRFFQIPVNMVQKVS